jgi:hypothetical protein
MVKEQTLEQRRKKKLGLKPIQDHGIRPVMLRENISQFKSGSVSFILPMHKPH